MVQKVKELPEDVMAAYMRRARAFKYLSREEEVALAGQIALGGRTGELARDRLVTANLRAVVWVANRFRSSGIPLEDLVQEGNLGLMNAATKFNPDFGVRFYTYALWWVRQSIQRYCQEKGRLVALPHGKEKLVRKLNATRQRLAQTQAVVTDEDLAAEMEISTDDVQDLLMWMETPVSFSAPVGEDGASFGDFIADKSAEHPLVGLEAGDIKKLADQCLKSLNPRLKRIIEGRFSLTGDEPMTLEELGKELRLTRERVRQLEVEAFKKLRREAAKSKLKSCL